MPIHSDTTDLSNKHMNNYMAQAMRRWMNNLKLMSQSIKIFKAISQLMTSLAAISQLMTSLATISQSTTSLVAIS